MRPYPRCAGVQLHLLKRHEGFIVIQRPSAGIGGPSGLFLHPLASQDRLDRIFREADTELSLKIPGKSPVPKSCPLALLYNQLLKWLAVLWVNSEAFCCGLPELHHVRDVLYGVIYGEPVLSCSHPLPVSLTLSVPVPVLFVVKFLSIRGM